MDYKDFKFVDLAIGGATKRNNVVPIDAINVSKDAVDTYTTMFRFREEYKEHVESTGSVRGADKFECWSDYLWFDIDADDLQDATIDMQALLRGIKSMGALEHTVVFFSGSKGYHIGINSGLFGFKPSKTLPDEMRRTCVQIASLFHVEIDTKVYNHNRLWRVVDTFHSKTKLRKTALDPVKAQDLTIDEIKKIASSGKVKRNPRYIVCTHTKPVDSLVRLSREASAGAVAKSANWDAPPLSDRRAREYKAALDILLKTGASTGNRDNEALLRASECRKIGIEYNEALSLLIEWNKLNKRPDDSPAPLEMDDLIRVTESAYYGAGYDFGTNNESLRAAREQARRDMETINVDDLLKDENKSEEADVPHERRPYSLSELLAEGYKPEMPELVGEYFSWRKRITLLVGREKLSGKSTLCTFEAMAALRKGYRVMWVSPDEPQDDIVYRFMKAGATEYKEQLFIASDMNIPVCSHKEDGWHMLANYIADVRPDLIILDSIHSLFPYLDRSGSVPDSSEGAEWQRRVAMLRPVIIALNAAVVWIHHGNKHDGTAIGSIGITAAPDAIIQVDNIANRAHPNRRYLQFLGRRVNTKMNCYVDYIDEENGFVRLEDEQFGHDAKPSLSKKDEIVEALQDFVASYDGDTITQDEAVQHVKQHANVDISGKRDRQFKLAWAAIKRDGIIGETLGKPGQTGPYEYPILTRPSSASATNAIKDEEDGEEI